MLVIPNDLKSRMSETKKIKNQVQRISALNRQLPCMRMKQWCHPLADPALACVVPLLPNSPLLHRTSLDYMMGPPQSGPAELCVGEEGWAKGA